LGTSSIFTIPEVYVLRLTADDGPSSNFAEVTITVNPAANTAPTVSAGTDQAINLPNSATLDGAITDGGLDLE
jgi:hypothetical protein